VYGYNRLEYHAYVNPLVADQLDEMAVRILTPWYRLRQDQASLSLVKVTS
jgi:hypothetical protein